MDWVSYSDVMGASDAYFEVTLDLSDPIEVGDFAAFFAGLAGQFDDWLASTHPDLKGTAKLYVREVRHGSIVAQMFPFIQDAIGVMDGTLIVLGFGAIFSKRIRGLIAGHFISDGKKSDIKQVGQTIRGVAHDKDGDFRLKSFTYEKGLWKERVELEFNTKEARQAVATLELQKRSLDKKDHVDYERVLMRFTRSDIGDAEVGKRSGELAVIEHIQAKPLPIAYGSELAEERLKDEIRDHESVYYKGFVVDVNVEQSNGRNVAYSVTHVHQVIDLPIPTDEDL